MPLYHCSPVWLEPGSIIRPGNYGRILRVVGPQHNHWLREQFLEFVRKHEFSDKPSRLASAFACEDLVAAQFFKERNCRWGIIYEAEMTDPKGRRTLRTLTASSRSGGGSRTCTRWPGTTGLVHTGSTSTTGPA